MTAFTFVTMIYPDRSIPMVVSPTREVIEAVLRNPKKFGDKGEIGGLQLDCEEEIPGQTEEPIIISASNPPFVVNLHFFLGIPNYVMLFYTHTGKGIYEKVIGEGKVFNSESFIAYDLGGSDMELDKANLLSIDEALDLAVSFVESEGDIEIS